jgi:betaine-aldehyde dehydrogenase
MKAKANLPSEDVLLDGVLLDGVWQQGRGPVLEIIDPARAEVFAQVSGADADAVAATTQAARRALPAWSRLPPRQRGEILRAIARNVEAARTELVALQMRNNGKPRHEAEMDVGDVVATFDYYAGCCDSGSGLMPRPVELPDDAFSAKVRFEPVGVVGLIVPWNFPMVTTAWKLAPALAAGCTVVLKPSEVTPLPELELAAIIDTVGLPAGVLNVVNGTGPEVGAVLASDRRIAKVSFTGSTAVGRQVMKAAADTIKGVSLELGGKSPIVVFADADLDLATELILGGIFFNAGQMCSATSRLLVEASIADALLDRVASRAAALKVGDPLADDTQMGPLTNAAQYRRVLGFIEQGKADGARLLTGGGRPAGVGDSGYFLAPTIFADVPDHSSIWRDEIFGPVLCVKRFSDEAEAIALANDSDYGLAATVVTSDDARGRRVSNALKAGVVWLNAPQVIFPHTSWGGFKQSSLGRELGPFGLAAFQEIKQVLSGQA